MTTAVTLLAALLVVAFAALGSAKLAAVPAMYPATAFVECGLKSSPRF